ncbi:nuclear transport factor 2 family protein [Mycolicibacter senuensis]|uniref:Polyketide cyclase n=1 Tax=Mycolicibacter senuensis TaxID=386913 RepID=A0A7I9XRB8_9MYCO|nr:nuclear transport factor 2 family protein [Mycolicibacter senuensis]MDQ2627920.1 nuclear transport factor 2 family protein [Actinomycetota bacterium]ORW64954.1 polyketide cyclase [Mycolicibacter senuensis]GFG72541.1 polyketide cyclase [Mycolicibacter senuensis]
MTDDAAAKADISEVLLRYATAIDTKDWGLFRSCFTHDVDADYGEIGKWSDADSITEFMTAVHEAMSDTKHMLHNMVIEVDGGHATAVTYVHTVQALAADPKQWVDAVGQYRDELLLTPDGWRISRRHFTQTRLLSSFELRGVQGK